MRLQEGPEAVEDPSGIPVLALRGPHGRFLFRDDQVDALGQDGWLSRGPHHGEVAALGRSDQRRRAARERQPRGERLVDRPILGRMYEGRVALEEVLKRFPEWEVDRTGARIAPTSTVRGFETLPVFTP